MDVLGIATVLVPPDPGNVSAFGLLTVDVRNDYVQTHVRLADRLDVAEVAATYDDLTGRARAALLREGFAEEQHGFLRTADLRYFGQAFEVRVPVPDGGFGVAAAVAVAERFHAEHRTLYGYDFAADGSQQVEWVNLRVSGIGPIQRPEIRRHARGQTRQVSRPDPPRPVCFDADEGYIETAVRDRAELRPGEMVSGPVIIEEYGSTVPIHPGFKAEVDDYLNLIVTRIKAAEL